MKGPNRNIDNSCCTRGGLPALMPHDPPDSRRRQATVWPQTNALPVLLATHAQNPEDAHRRSCVTVKIFLDLTTAGPSGESTSSVRKMNDPF